MTNAWLGINIKCLVKNTEKKIGLFPGQLEILGYFFSFFIVGISAKVNSERWLGAFVHYSHQA